ncbi:MAG: ornithine carbamoyltransferase [Oscillospiraceae bacterium]|jgi:ornithine carbamoyltransferase|nr:ornithine carbamoyltransferase [Oscillospiraceae bacterium]
MTVKHLLKMSDLTQDDIMEILALADQMKFNQQHKLSHRVLEGKTLGMIFTKASTRTRVSFEAGMFQLGGHAICLTSADAQFGRGEPVEDTANVMSRYVDGVMIRTFAQKDVEDFARYGNIPVINGLTDDEHPCQILADLMTVREHLATLAGLTACWVGDGNNVCCSLISGALTCGMKIRVACPEGYEPRAEILETARKNPDFALLRDPREAAEGANVVFTDVFASMGQEGDAQKRLRDFAGYQINWELLSLCAKNVIVQHCLPAHRGEEITAEAFAAHAKEIYDETENRLHVQKAVMALLMGEQD